MSPESFKYILNVVGPSIQKNDSRFRKAISPSEKLSLTLHYLAYGSSQQSISFSYRLGRSTVSGIIKETCEAIWDCLSEKYCQSPQKQEHWKKISEDFEEIWNLPHCVGAVDGKHVAIKSPLNSGSLYFNYKGFFSLILMVVCDARYVFTLVDIGSYGSNNDSGVFCNSKMGKALFQNKMNLPNSEPIKNSSSREDVPYFLVGDEAFPLQPWLLRPYSGKNISEEHAIFNFRLSRARLVIENAFGILAARWRIFLQPIQSNVDTANKIIKAAICMHNFLRQTNSAMYCPTGFIDSFDSTGRIKKGEWRDMVSFTDGMLRNIGSVRGSRPTTSAIETRDEITKYVNSMEGSLSWQWEHIRSRGIILQ